MIKQRSAGRWFVAGLVLFAGMVCAAWPVHAQDYYDTDRLERDRRPKQDEEVTVLIKECEMIYGTWSGLLLFNDVNFNQVPPERARNYFDDGTHGDEIAFDGLPSRVTMNREDYISYYAITIWHKLVQLKNKALTEESARMVKVAEWERSDLWDPLRFYSGLYVTSLDEDSKIPKFVDQFYKMSDYWYGYDATFIAQFRINEQQYYQPQEDQERPDWQRAVMSFVLAQDAVEKYKNLWESMSR